MTFCQCEARYKPQYGLANNSEEYRSAKGQKAKQTSKQLGHFDA